jgi:hypothetical protein
MSELTSCNYCTLKRIKARAEKDGNQVIVKGQNVYVIPKGRKLTPEDKFTIWFMSLTNHCVC